MKQGKFLLLTILTGLLFSLDQAIAQSEYERAQIVIQRKLAMNAMLTSYFPLLSIRDGKSTDLSVAEASARAIRDGIIESLKHFPEGTAKDEAAGSRARPEVWLDNDAFLALANALVDRSTDLMEAAATGDMEEFTATFSGLAKACVGCHEFRPSAGGRFRFPQ